MMKLTVLGLNGPFPAPDGACSGYFLQSGDTRVQIDLGTGVLAALTARTAPEELSAIVLTHWHFDHCSDLLPLINRMESFIAAGHAPVPVYAPADAASPVRAIVQKSAAFALHDIADGDTVGIGTLSFRFFTARHPVPAVMLRVTDGSRTLCFTGDTNTMDTLPVFVRGADLLLADGLFTRELWSERKPHLSAAHCAALAAENEVGRLLITHLNPSIDPQTLLREARAVWPKAELAHRFETYEL